MKKNKLVGKIIDCALNILIVLFAIFLLISMYTAVQVKILKNEYANFFGYSLFEVQTGSMHGTIEAGDWIIVKTTKDVQVRDIITYKHGNDFITHRVVEIYKGSYVTKGDANTTKDEPIDREQVVGKHVKTLHGFGILRKTIFNPIVIVSLLICLYLFNLTFKTGKTEFDLVIEKIIKIIKKKIFNKNFSNKNEIKSEKVKVILDNPKDIASNVPTEPLPANIITVVNDNESLVDNKDNDIIDDKKVLDEYKEEVDDDKFGNTAMFRMIDVQPDEKPHYYHEEDNGDTAEVVDINVDELSKTSVFRIISADSNDVDKEENKKIEKQKEKFTEVVSLKLNAEEITPPVKIKEITKEYISEKIKSKKAKNILDKTFFIKRIVYDEILDVLLEKDKAYILKSPLRKDFVEQYMNFKFFGIDSDRTDIKKLMSSYCKDLKSKFIRDERKVKTIDAYSKAFEFINNIENKSGNIDFKKEISSYGDFDDEVLDKMSFDIGNIVSYSNECLNEILDKLDTNTFKDQYNKIVGQKNLYGVVLNHNISFSKVYSDYIVDKTYTEGIVAEDKIAVLLNLLLCKIVKDLMKHDYDSKYIVYVPNALYGKEKKLDKIFSTIDNDYAKSHVFFLTSASNMLVNEDDVKRLSKKGYHFALSFNKPVKFNSEDIGYIYLADYYFIDSHLDAEKVCETLPSEIIDKLIKENLDKKIGDYKGD